MKKALLVMSILGMICVQNLSAKGVYYPKTKSKKVKVESENQQSNLSKEKVKTKWQKVSV